MVEKRVYERGTVRTAARVDGQPLRFVDYGDIAVLIHDIERNVFRFRVKIFGRLRNKKDFVPRFERFIALNFPAI